MFPSFIPHPLVRGGHAQTILGCYLPGLTWAPQSELHLVALPDGDRLVLHDDVPAEGKEAGRVALLVHGLGGSHQSTYMQRTADKLVAKGVRVFRMDLRGCGAGTGLADPDDKCPNQAEDPDGFIRAKIADFAAGDRGNPTVPEAIMAMLGAKP